MKMPQQLNVWRGWKSLRLFRIGVAIVFPFVLALLVSQARAQDDGKALFKAKCAVCHAENGDASTVVGRGMKLRDLRSAEVQKQTDNQLATIVHCGKGKMPGYEGRLSDEQISQLVRYMRNLPNGARQP